ncbi:MAG: hypothetical protein KatS3mg076_2305 [Candidatus Binatia bacterium]|nr:MAG: hypothetical protein KatS3mg076_2305 [Candidatus Binatia bacterium]
MTPTSSPSARILPSLLLLVFLPWQALAARLYVLPEPDRPGSHLPPAPYLSLSEALEAARPGDTVIVLPGILRESVTVAIRGEPGRPVVIRGLPGAILESPDPGRSLSAFDVVAPTAWVRIEGFEIRGDFDEAVFVRSGTHDVVLSDLRVHGNRKGIWIAGATHVRVRNSLVHDNSGSGIRVFGTADSIFIENSESRDNRDGEGCRGDADGLAVEEEVGAVTVDGFRASGNSEDGLDLKSPVPVLSRVESLSNGCTGIKLWQGGTVQNAAVFGHRIGVSNSSGVLLLANVTLQENLIGLRAGENTVVTIVNSIVSGPGKALILGKSATFLEDSNIFFRPTHGPLLEIHDEDSRVRFSFGSLRDQGWNTFRGENSGTLLVDPRLSDLGEPSPRSPAVDSGNPSLAPAYDLRGTLRPLGTGPDRGAIETGVREVLLSVDRFRATAGSAAGDRFRLRGRSTAILPSPNALDFRLESGNRRVVETTFYEDDILTRRWGFVAFRSDGGRRVLLRVRQKASGTEVRVVGRGVELWRLGDDVRVDFGSGDVRVRGEHSLAVRALRGGALRIATEKRLW